MSEAVLSPSFALCGIFEDAQLRFFLKTGLNRVGCLPSSEIPLKARGVSKRHAILVIQNGRLILEDLASKNGSFVNGARVENATVKPGDQVRFGEITLSLEEVSPADGELAIALEDRARHDRPSALSNETSRLPSLNGAGAAGKWLAVAEGLVERLCGPADGFTSALALLVTGIGARGAWILDLAEGDSPVVLASYGEIHGRATRGVRLAIGDEGNGVKVQYFSADSMAGAPLAVATTAAGNPLALALWGDVSERPESTYLLRLLLHLVAAGFRSRRPQTEPPTATPSGFARDRPGLVFPAGYVRCESPKMMALYQQAQAVARSDLPILILGETGVGKEGIARILHRSSGRAPGPFIAINCAAIPADLLEAELFGIGKAVATGVAERKGKFVLAAGGTLFLDEIGDMPRDLQAKLLRTLQEKEIQPVGGSAEPIDARVIAATNSSLSRRIEAGTFRNDLYYRLAGMVLTVPQLHEHKEDVPALVEHFLRMYSQQASKPVRGMTLEALRDLIERPWPGNIRELEYEVRRLVYLCPVHQVIDSSMLTLHIEAAGKVPPAAEQTSAPAATPPGVEASSPLPSSGGSRELDLADVKKLRLADVEKQVVLEALTRCGWNRTRAAKLLGISREALRRRIARHQLGESLPQRA